MCAHQSAAARETGNCCTESRVSRGSGQSKVCLSSNGQEIKEEAKVGPQRPGDHYFSGTGNAKAIPFGQKEFGVHVRKPFPIFFLCVCASEAHSIRPQQVK